MPQSIILDTDIGDDVDDALALAVALHSPELELVGITTVFRDAPRRALLTREVLKKFGREEVPIYAGCSDPLIADWHNLPDRQKLGRQFEALDADLKWEDTSHAVNFLISTAREHIERGEKLVFVAIGALTNIALALHLAPDIVTGVEVHMMGGLWGRAEMEWNIRCDPEAAAMVFRSGVPLWVVSIDVTEQVVLSDEQVQQLATAKHEGARFLAQLIGLWGHRVVLHDPLTILSLFADIVTFEPMRLEVGLCGAERAFTQRSEGEANARVSTQVKVEAAIDLFLERILANS